MGDGILSAQYWLARKTFDLPGQVDTATFTIVADRHYELYVNGGLVTRHRNFFNGDEYLYSQRWDKEVANLLVRGWNTIDVVIRSDPCRNKNHRYFQPMLLVDAKIHSSGKFVSASTDQSWRVAPIEGWRTPIATGGSDAVNGTIQFEKVVLFSSNEAVLSGFKEPTKLSVPSVRNIRDLPSVYLWNDTPKRVDVHRPCVVVDSGSYELHHQVIGLGADLACSSRSCDQVIAFNLRFDDTGEHELSFACSSLIRFRLEMNGVRVSQNDQSPDLHQMALPDSLIPAGNTKTREGANHIRISVNMPTNGWQPFRLAVRGLPDALDDESWHLDDGSRLDATTEPIELSERIGAKITKQAGDVIDVRDDPIELELPGSFNNSFVTLDFGKVVNGRLKIKIRALSCGRIYLAYGMQHKDGAVDCSRMHLRAVDVLEVPKGNCEYLAFDIRTFRYLDLLFEGFTSALNVSGVEVKEKVFLDGDRSNINIQHSQICDLWRASKRTAQLCGNEIYVCNPEREHAQWIDCCMSIGAAGYYAFGEEKRTAKALKEFILAQESDGQLPGYTPGLWFPRKPLQCHMAIFGLLSHLHFMYTGDYELGARTFRATLKILDFWAQHKNRHGLISDLHTVFIDWGSHIYSYGRGSQGKTGALTALNAYYLGVLKAAARMAHYLGEKREEEMLGAAAVSLRLAMIDQMYDPEIDLFRDGSGNRAAENNISQTANALAVLFGASPERCERNIIEAAFGPNKFSGIIPANAHFVWQAGQAMFEAGCDRLALSWITDGFGPMLDNSAGTLWETWQPLASLCHATGAGIAFLLSRYLVGIYPVEPGFGAIGFSPCVAGLDHLEADVSTPVGLIGVRWRRNGSQLKGNIVLPPELAGRRIEAPDWVKVKVDCSL